MDCIYPSTHKKERNATWNRNMQKHVGVTSKLASDHNHCQNHTGCCVAELIVWFPYPVTALEWLLQSGFLERSPFLVSSNTKSSKMFLLFLGPRYPILLFTDLFKNTTRKRCRNNQIFLSHLIEEFIFFPSRVST